MKGPSPFKCERPPVDSRVQSLSVQLAVAGEAARCIWQQRRLLLLAEWLQPTQQLAPNQRLPLRRLQGPPQGPASWSPWTRPAPGGIRPLRRSSALPSLCEGRRCPERSSGRARLQCPPQPAQRQPRRDAVCTAAPWSSATRHTEIRKLVCGKRLVIRRITAASHRTEETRKGLNAVETGSGFIEPIYQNLRAADIW